MAGEKDGTAGPDPVVRHPLPPEVPAPLSSPEDDDEILGQEWWRRPPEPAPPEIPAPRAEPSPQPPPQEPAEPGRAEAPGPAPSGPDTAAEPSEPAEWWRSSDVREEWRDTWATHGQEGIAAAHEIGAHIGEAISAHLPDPHAAAARRGLDIRWLRLKYNVPAVAFALLVTWRGQSAVDRMSASVTEDGIFAPLGWVLLFALALGVFLLLPIGSWLGSALAGLVTAVVHGLVRLFGRAWKTPYIGYLLRLAVAVAAWSFVIAVARLVGRGAVRLLTGA